uniref:Chitin-binding type-2 domain-containing protein n=1 Tax=Anopheles minimus TaxID=112268 RepID=A0A182WEN5_9DIPT
MGTSTEEHIPYVVSQGDLSLDSVCVGVVAGIVSHPDPALCHVYIMCTAEQPYAYQCTEEFIFDPISLRCIQGDRDRCPERIETDWDEFCTDVSNAFYEHPGKCWEFVHCSLGTVNRYSCPIGEIWSQRNGACLPGSWDTCELLNMKTVCQGRPDGALTYPTDCTRYLRCANGQPSIVDCPRGEVFEAVTGRCVVGNTETCTRIDSICRGVVDGTVLAHPNECDSYISCQGGISNANKCPTGEILNAQAQFCAPGNPDTCEFYPLTTMCRNMTSGAIYPLSNDCTQFAVCNSGESSTMKCPIGQILHAPSRSCRPGNTETCEFIESVCQDQPDGTVIAHPSLCGIFISCQAGEIMIRSCPNREILRPDTQVCVPGNSLTCEFEPLQKMCIGQINSANFPHPTDCDKFVVCQGQNVLIQNCPSGSVYNAVSRSCAPGNESTCERFDDICTGRPDGIIPHPTICTAFVYCSSGRPLFEQCAPGTVYKQGLSGCVVGNTETCAHATNICSDHPDGAMLDHPNECSLLITCMMQQPGVLECPAGEIYNRHAKHCSPGDSKTCQVHPVETMCKNMRAGSVYPHPSDCTQYVRCNGAQPILTACPLGHILHASSGSCRPGNTDTCELIENVCQNQTSSLIVKHPSQCGQFLLCQGGRMTIQQCPVGEIVREDAQFCVPGDVSSCEFHPVDQMCIKRPDRAQFPHPTECASYVTCQGQKAIVQSCSNGSVYHAPTRSCMPGNQDTCERFDNICSGHRNGLIPHPMVCTAYINCISNKAVFEQCAHGTVFDRELGGCIVGNTKTCARAEGLCVGQPNGAIIGHPNECGIYIMCVSQAPAPMRCPAGQIFKLEAQYCVPGKAESCQFNPVETMCSNMMDNAIYPHPNDCTQFVKCNRGKPIVNDCPVGEIIHGLSKTCRPGNTKTCKFIDRVCLGQPDGAVIEHPSLCGQFIKCRYGAVTVQSCPDGKIFRPDSQLCVMGNKSTCEFETVERMCIGKTNDHVYSHPSDCRSFIRCQNEIAEEEKCRPGTIFQATNQTCVAGNGNTCTFLGNMCVGRSDGVLPHPQGCDLFLMCTSGTTSALRCPEGEILHPEKLVCATGNAADCKLAPVTTEPPIFSVCDGRPDGKYAHPMMCYHYIQCTRGVAEFLTCPSNQIFVGAIRNCAPEGKILHPESLVCTTGNTDDWTLVPVTTESTISIICNVPMCSDRFDPHQLLCILLVRCNYRDTEILSCLPNMIFNSDLGYYIPGN